MKRIARAIGLVVLGITTPLALGYFAAIDYEPVALLVWFLGVGLFTVLYDWEPWLYKRSKPRPVEPPAPCPHCQRTLRTQRGLQQHVAAKHAPEPQRPLWASA
jgi:hypothetical protein